MRINQLVMHSLVSDCYHTAAICRWNGTYVRRVKNLEVLVDRKILDHWFNYFTWKLDSKYEHLKIYASILHPKYVGVSFMESIIYKDLYIKIYLVALRFKIWKTFISIFNHNEQKEISNHFYSLSLSSENTEFKTNATELIIACLHYGDFFH